MADTTIASILTVQIADADRWTSAHRHAADDAHTSSYTGWVMRQVREAMLAAGRAWVAANPDLFA